MSHFFWRTNSDVAAMESVLPPMSCSRETDEIWKKDGKRKVGGGGEVVIFSPGRRVCTRLLRIQTAGRRPVLSKHDK